MRRDGSEILALVDRKMAVSSAAKCVRFFQDRVEHRGEVAGGGVDDPQHLSCRGLLIERFGEFSFAIDECSFIVGKPASQFGVLALEIARPFVQHRHFCRASSLRPGLYRACGCLGRRPFTAASEPGQGNRALRGWCPHPLDAVGPRSMLLTPLVCRSLMMRPMA